MGPMHRLHSRHDRIGSNFALMLAEYAYCNANQFRCCIAGDFKYKDLFPFFIFDECPENDRFEESTLPVYHESKNLTMCLSRTVLHFRRDLPSVIGEMKHSLYRKIKTRFTQMGEENPVFLWPQSKRVICIHLRLEDVSDREYSDITRRAARRGIELLDHDTEFGCRQGNWMFKASGELIEHFSGHMGQCSISDDTMRQTIRRFQREYPDHEVHLIAHPSGKTTLSSEFLVHRPREEATALWNMMHADVLVLSCSTFSLTAAFLHQGSRVYYPSWNHFSAIGLGTKFDRSSWTCYLS